MTTHGDPPAPEHVPSAVLREALAAAGCGTVAQVAGAWAVRGPDGSACTVQAVPAECRTPALDDRVRVLRGVDDPQVAHVETVVEAGGELAVVLGGSRGPTLAEALRRRGPLDARETVALVAALAHALAVLHRAGLVHGALSASDVVVDAAGRAHLRPRVVVPPAGATRHDDVRALAVLALEALGTGAQGGPAGGEGPALDHPDDPVAAVAAREAGLVRRELSAALLPDEDGPLEVGTLAARVAETADPAPIVVPDLAELAARALADEAVRRAGRSAPDHGRRTPAAGRRRVPGVVRAPSAAAATGDGRAAPQGEPASEPAQPRAVAVCAQDEGLARLRGRSGERASRRRRHARRRAVGGACVLVVAVAVVSGVVRGAGHGSLRLLRGTWGASTAAPADPVEPVPVVSAAAVAARGGGSPGDDRTKTAVADATLDRADPESAARELTRRRARLLAGAAVPADVTVVGSAAAAADQATLAAVAARGRLVAAPSIDVESSRLVAQGASTGSTSRVDVTYAVGEAQIVSASGRGVVPAAPRRTDRLVLVWTDAGWRVSAVEQPVR